MAPETSFLAEALRRGARLVPPLARPLLGSRLVQFLLLGGLLFCIAPAAPRPDRVELTAAERRALYAAQARRLAAPRLRPEQERAIDSRAIEDEVLFREALRLGLGRGDGVVRQRLIQKVLFLAEDLAGVGQPASEAELRAFFEATRAQWRRPARVRLLHVYGTVDHQAALAALLPEAQRLDAAAPEAPLPLGDAFPLPRAVHASREELAQSFGDDFAAQVFAQPPGGYGAPLRSRYGFHLVKVAAREEAGAATFDEVRGQLPLAYLLSRKRQAVAAFLAQAMGRYDVVIAGRGADAYQPTGRTGSERGERGERGE